MLMSITFGISLSILYSHITNSTKLIHSKPYLIHLFTHRTFVYPSTCLFNNKRPAPHSKALNNGIDSLTIQINLSTKDQLDKLTVGTKINTFLYGIEHLTRGLNSLQELLHHNVNQYIMVSTMKFVSFDEYLLPIILILIPLVLRVLMIMYYNNDHDSSSSNDSEHNIAKEKKKEEKEMTSLFKFTKGLKGVGGSIILSILVLWMNHVDKTCIVSGSTSSGSDRERVSLILNSAFCISYVIILRWVIGSKTKTDTSTSHTVTQRREEKQILQLLSCLMALYIHVPIALVHMALGLVSALFWVPILAFPSHKTNHRLISKIGTLLSRIIVILMLPPIAKNILIHILSWIVNELMLSSTAMTVIPTFATSAISTLKEIDPLSSTYFCYVYIPLHFMLSVISFN
jgi:hypothetical protein